MDTKQLSVVGKLKKQQVMTRCGTESVSSKHSRPVAVPGPVREDKRRSPIFSIRSFKV
jgi:hypothetical protein